MRPDVKMTMEIRLATPEDARGIAEIYRPVVLSTPISFEVEPPDESEMRRRIQETLMVFPWLVCARQSDVVGYAYAGRHRARAAYQWSVDTSVYVHSDSRRRGIGRALYTALFEILTAQGYFNAYAGITLPNAASVGLHESVGFEPVGVYRDVGYKHGVWYDVGWWQRPLQPSGTTPRPPIRLAGVQSRPAWQRMLDAGLAWLRNDTGA